MGRAWMPLEQSRAFVMLLVIGPIILKPKNVIGVMKAVPLAIMIRTSASHAKLDGTTVEVKEPALEPLLVCLPSILSSQYSF